MHVDVLVYCGRYEHSVNVIRVMRRRWMSIPSLWLFGYVDKDGKGQSAVTMFGAKETNREL